MVLRHDKSLRGTGCFLGCVGVRTCARVCPWVGVYVVCTFVCVCVGVRVLSCGGIPSLTVTWLPMTVQLGLFKEFNTLSVMYEDLSENFIEQKPPYSVVKDSAPDGSLKAGAVT